MKLFKSKPRITNQPINSNQDFWNWFTENEKTFFNVINNQGNVERDFFSHLSENLNKLRDGYWFLAGMFDDNTAELVLTVDGVIKNIAFAEELVKAAPEIENWKFTALKPALDISNVCISMGDLEFSKDNLFFHSNDNPAFPDVIDISVVHADYSEELKNQITNGIYIFLDNYLGELNAVTNIDNVQVISKEQAVNEIIPIEKLQDFLIWRQKEFIEKYDGIRYDTDDDNYHSLEATLNNGKPLLAVVNSALLNWDRKASHPWILTIEIKYRGNKSGMPDNETYELMNVFEDELMLELKDADGYLNIGRETADEIREIYFACKDFRLPSRVLSKFQRNYESKLNVEYDIFKDKYWQSFERFKPRVD